MFTLCAAGVFCWRLALYQQVDKGLGLLPEPSWMALSVLESTVGRYAPGLILVKIN